MPNIEVTPDLAARIDKYVSSQLGKKTSDLIEETLKAWERKETEEDISSKAIDVAINEYNKLWEFYYQLLSIMSFYFKTYFSTVGFIGAAIGGLFYIQKETGFIPLSLGVILCNCSPPCRDDHGGFRVRSLGAIGF